MFIFSLDQELRVIPEAINATSIRIIGTSSSFNITWNPVTNVNFGQVFYDIKTDDKIKESIVKVQGNYLVYDRAKELPPYSELKVTIQAFTYWGSSPQVIKKVYSPPSLPGVPTNLRIFVSYQRNIQTGGKQAITLLRWNPPERPNGVITAYKVKYFYAGEDRERFFDVYLEGDKLEVAFDHLQQNFTYFFQVSNPVFCLLLKINIKLIKPLMKNYQVKAFTLAGEGRYTKPIEANIGVETPVPMLLITTRDSIKILDCDSGNHMTLASGDHPIDITLNSNEGWIYWLNDMQEIIGMKIDGTKKSKVSNVQIFSDRIQNIPKISLKQTFQIHLLNGTGLSLTIDWIGRYLYWSEVEEKGTGLFTSSIYRLDLSQVEDGIFQVDKILKRNGQILEIEILPFSNVMYWIEVAQDGGSHLMQSRTDGSGLSSLFPIRRDKSGQECTCSEKMTIGKTMTVDQTDPYNVAIIFDDDFQEQVHQTESQGCECKLLVHSSKLPPTSITTDHRYLYWSNKTEDSIFILNEDLKIQRFEVEGVRKIMAIGSHLQPFPPSVCLRAQITTSIPTLLENTATSITLQLPKPDRHSECNNLSLPSVQYVLYFDLVSENGISECIEDVSKCKFIVTYQQTVKIKDLQPFSAYIFMISLKNYFTAFEGPALGPPVIFATLAGAPSAPQNVTAMVLNPNSVAVNWVSTNNSIDKTISYQVHWRTEGMVAGVRQSGEQIVEKADPDGSSQFSVVVRKLIPGQTYLIWVRAYSRHSPVHNESEKVEVETFDQPDNITLVQASPYSLEVSWMPPNEHVRDYDIQFRLFSSFEEWINVATVGDNNYSIDNLLPKTSYGFRAAIVYMDSKETYVWPQDGEFVFETLGRTKKIL